ncbi:MAG: N-6 DNA methylase, partial [Bdellovibrionales bacterium]|nr:N-6 DNA methylase [Bdellovibrionales bacterium]
ELFGGAEIVQEQQLEFDLSGITEQQFFDQAEEAIYESLRKYASETSEGGFRRKLFAGDAEKGFAFIELMRKRFDVALMNPPFGEYSSQHKSQASEQYLSGGHDILTAFVQRGMQILHSTGSLGAITSRTVFFAPSTREWREFVVDRHGVLTWLDLGEGVLDDATVETCMYTLAQNKLNEESIFVEDVSAPNLSGIVGSIGGSRVEAKNIYPTIADQFTNLPGAPFAYWIKPDLLHAFKLFPNLEASGIEVKVGLQTGDDFRFLRLWWEVPISECGWLPHAKGGENNAYATDIHLVANWKGNGREMKAQPSIRLNMYTRTDPSNGLPSGLTFPYRTYRFSPAIMPKGILTGVAGMGVYSEDYSLFELAAILNSSILNELIRSRLQRRSLDSLYQAGCINPMPLPELDSTTRDRLRQLGEEMWAICKRSFVHSENSEYSIPPILRNVQSLSNFVNERNKSNSESSEKVVHCFHEADELLGKAYHLSNE